MIVTAHGTRALLHAHTCTHAHCITQVGNKERKDKLMLRICLIEVGIIFRPQKSYTYMFRILVPNL